MLYDKLYTEQMRRERLREVRRQEAELARQSSKSYTTAKLIDQTAQQRDELLKAYSAKAKLLQELEVQREAALAQLGNAHRQAEVKEREDETRTREREEWLKQAADRAAERGREALSQATEFARSKKESETFLQRRREEVLKAETFKAQQLAAAWQDKQWAEAKQKAEEDAANYIPPGGLVVKGQLDFSKTHFHNPVILKHELSQKTGAETAAETETLDEVKAAERQNLQDQQRRVALERGHEALTKEQLKLEHARLLSELEKLRKADGELKAAQGAKEQTSASRVSLTHAKKEALKKQRAEKQFQEIFLSNGKSSILENAPQLNVWEQQKQDAKPPAFSIPDVPAEPMQPKKLLIREGAANDPFESLVSSYKTQTESLVEDHEKPESSEISEEEAESPESSCVEDEEPLESEGSDDEKEDDYEYSEESSEAEEEKLPAKYTQPAWKMNATKKRTSDDALVKELTDEDPDIRQIWGEVRGTTRASEEPRHTYKSHSEVLEVDNSSVRSSPASSFSKPPVPRFEKSIVQKEQYYSDLLTTPAFSKNQPTFRPNDEEQKDTADLGIYSAAKASMKESLLSESFSSLLNSRSTGKKSQDFDRYLRSEQSDTFKLSQTDDLRYSKTEARLPGDTQDKIDDFEELLQSKKNAKAPAWEIETKPEKRQVPSRPERQRKIQDEVKRAPPRKESEERQGEVWTIGIDSTTQKRSLADAFLAKKHDLAGKLEQRELKTKDQPKKEKTKEELLAIRKEMLKGPRRSKFIKVEVNKTQTANSRLMERLASGERTKVGDRQIDKGEMKQLTAKNYERLPEVKAKKEKEAKQAEIKKRIANAKEFEKVKPMQKRKESRLRQTASPGRFS